MSETQHAIVHSFTQWLRQQNLPEPTAVSELCEKIHTLFHLPPGFNPPNPVALQHLWDHASDAPEANGSHGSKSSSFSLSSSESKLQLTPQSPEEASKLRDFLSILHDRGYFKGADPGTPEHESRLDKARRKFFARQNPYEGLDAEQCKARGNAAMATAAHKEALGFYTRAIALDSGNHLYFANRSAAYIQMKEYGNAVTDAEKAIALEPGYAKSYARLGTAYFYEEKFQKASEAYARAVELDPQNASYGEDLHQARERVKKAEEAVAGNNPFGSLLSGLGGGGAPGSAGFDMNQLMGMMNKPEFMQMASQAMQNPQFTSLMQNFASQMGSNAPGMGDMQQFLSSMGNNALMGENGNALSNAAEGGDSSGTVQTPFGPLDAQALKQLQEEEVHGNPRMAEIVEDVRQNGPGAFMKHMNDPEVMAIMSKFTTLFSQRGEPKEE